MISHLSAAMEWDALGAFNVAFRATWDGTPAICW